MGFNEIDIKNGTLERYLPFYSNLNHFIHKKASNQKLFLGLFLIYFLSLGFLATLPSVDFDGDKLPDSEAKTVKTLVQVLVFAGSQLTGLHLLLITVLGFCAALVASMTISLVSFRLCVAEDSYFQTEGIYPFRAISISPLPAIWWLYYEFTEKSLMLYSILVNSEITESSFKDYSLYAPITQKWETFRFLVIFVFMTLLTGMIKVFFLGLTTSVSSTTTVINPDDSKKKKKIPAGLQKFGAFVEEEWMKSDPKPLNPEKGKKAIKKRK